MPPVMTTRASDRSKSGAVGMGRLSRRSGCAHFTGRVAQELPPKRARDCS
ncbi:hypothetical protein ACFPRL_19605 [Pseudoclavibacter helvolus]